MSKSYELQEVSLPSSWEEMLLSGSEYSFLQSWQFGELHKTLGSNVMRYAYVDGDTAMILSQLILVAARRGKVLQLRHAPVMLPGFHGLSSQEQEKCLDNFLSALKELGRQYVCDFIRIQSRSTEEESSILLAALDRVGFQKANIHNIDAEKTLVLDISKSDEDLLKNMRKNTRYYIRRAQKDGVTITTSKDIAAVDKFYEIHHDTTVRQQFKSYTQQYYRDFFSTLNSQPGSKLSAEIFLAHYQGKTIAAAIIVFMGKKAFYSDGGSLSEYANIPASYLIQWKAIERAKDYGALSYDFWGGVVPENEGRNYPWAGIDLFKRGFGGERVEYMHARDLGLSFKYPFTRLFESFERFRRGY